MTRIKIKGFEGLEELSCKPGKVNLITGGTGAGKTSFLDAVQFLLSGKGRRSRMVHEGEEVALLLLETPELKIKRRLPEGKSAGSLEVERGDAVLRSPQGFLDDMIGPYAFNPVDFILAKETEQKATLLSLVDLAVSEERWAELSGGELLPGVDYAAHPLEVLAQLEKALYDKRTGVNARKGEADTVATDNESRVPEGFDAEAVRGMSVTEISERLSEATRHNTERERRGHERERWEADAQVRSDSIKRLEERLETERAELETLLETIREAAQWMADHQALPVDRLQEQLQTFEAQRTTLAAHDQARTSKQEATGHKAEPDRLTALLTEVRAQPAQLLAAAAMPIEGLALDEKGRITIGGTPISDLSSGEQIDVAVRVAEALAGDLSVLLVDGAERLDTSARARLFERAQASGAQWFITLVTEGELEITALDGSPAETPEPVGAVA